MHIEASVGAPAAEAGKKPALAPLKSFVARPCGKSDQHRSAVSCSQNVSEPPRSEVAFRKICIYCQIIMFFGKQKGQALAGPLLGPLGT